MTMTQINGGTQIKSATITTTQLSGSAGITDGQLASVYLYSNGTRAMSGALNMGTTNQINNVANGTLSTDAINLGQAQALVQGINNKLSARASTNAETLTIVSGSVTTITGTTVDGVTISIGDPILIMNAPASTGAAGGTTLSTQLANGLYVCSANTTNLTVSRATDMSGSNGPFGAYVFVVAGATWGGGGFSVSTPSTEAAFTYGSGNISFVQFSGAGEIGVANVIGKSGNTISVNSMSTNQIILGNGGTPTITTLSGDVTVGATGATLIGASAVTLAKMANLAANSLIGNTTGSGATPTAVLVNTTPAVSTVAMWDSNVNLSANVLIAATNTIVTAAGVSTLTITSAQTQILNGTTTQTVKLPTTGVFAGQDYTIVNQSSGAVTVQSSGANTIAVLAGSTTGVFTAAKTTPTAAADWMGEVVAFGKAPIFLNDISLAGTDGKTLTVSNNLTLAGTDGTTMTFPGTSDTVVTLGVAQTLTSKTLTAPILGGSVTGTYTLAGTVTITSPTINSPTMTAPALGTVASGVITACTGSPTLTAPLLGTPASGILTNCTALPLGGLANLTADTVIGNNTGSSTTPVAVPLSNAGAAAASTIALWDTNKNLSANAFIPTMQTVTSAAGNTTLTVGSPQTTQITGSTTQTVTLPSGTTLANGQQFLITNRSSGVVTVNQNGATLLQTMAAGSQVLCTLINNTTSTGVWDAAYSLAGAGGGTVTAVSVVTANGFQGTSGGGTTPALTLQTSVASGLLASNGSGTIQAATGSNICAHFINRATVGSGITGTAPNGSYTTPYTLANTPISGTEMLFQNGLLLMAGAGLDYTISGAVITMLNAPSSGDILACSYWF
jgi:hypothetical protein